jgi:CubicO group peptidase (beta-lactamase class C family)
MIAMLVLSVMCLVEPPLADLGPTLDPIRAKHDLPALAAAVVVEGKVIAANAVGVRAKGSDAAVTIDDKWHLGSCAKAMTATLAAVFVEKGELLWDSPLTASFPGVVGDDGWKPATLHHLVTNRGGTPADLDKGGLWMRLWAFNGTGREARIEIAKGVLADAPIHTPGTKFLYSNAGFALAGAMLEAKADKPWEDLMAERLFKPLDITSAGFGAPGTKGAADQPRGHRDGKPIEPGPGSDNPPAIGPAGTVHMTITDWARFAAAHAVGERAAAATDRSRLLKPETYALLHAPFTPTDGKDKDRYACGWLVDRRPWAKGDAPGDTGRVLTHAGSNTMWYSVVWIAPERGFAVVVATNQGDGKAPQGTDAAAAAMIQAYLTKSGPNPERVPEPSR